MKCKHDPHYSCQHAHKCESYASMPIEDSLTCKDFHVVWCIAARIICKLVYLFLCMHVWSKQKQNTM